MANTNTDRNLLFGVLALQMGAIGQDQLLAALRAWVWEKGKPLGQLLVEQGALAPDARDKLDTAVQIHLDMHGNDPQKSLAAVGPIGPVRDELERVADDALRASLAQVGSGRPADRDPHDTRPPSAGVPAAQVASARPADGDPYGTRPPSAGAPTSAGLRFVILRPHAKGGLGEVFVAHDGELNRQVALKEIQGQHADHPESRSRFLLEAEVTGGLEHPGIVPVYGLGHYPDGRPFYAMRFIKGDSLHDAIKRFHQAEAPGRDPGERALALRGLLRRFVDVCNAVAYAHSRGVVHRDLKPDNVMLGKYGETLVVDWGLAKPLGQAEGREPDAEPALQPSAAGDRAATRLGSAVGTPAYMSPEQAAGRLDQLGPASDVYSLGATLYCLLTGRPPFREADLGRLLKQVQWGEFTAPRRINARTPPALEATCLRAMARNPGDRYASARALADDVEHWLADEPVAAYRDPLLLRARRWARRHKPLVAGVAAALVTAVLLGGSGGLWYQREQARRADEQARRDHEEALRRGQPEGAAAAAARVAEARRGEALPLTDQPAAWRAALARAQAAARQAQALLDQAGAAADPDLQRRVRELTAALAADKRDRALAAKVDHLRLEQSNLDPMSHRFKRGQSFPQLRAALEAYGLRVGDAAQAVALVGGRPEPVREKLVAALDICLANARREGDGVRAWLLAVLAGVDGDPWRTRARRATAGGDGPALARLVREPDAGRQPPAFLALLAVDFPLPDGPDKIELLRRVQQRYPGDFWSNHDLASALYQRVNPAGSYRVAAADELPLLEEALGFYRAALALRPGSPGVYLNLGLALAAKGDLAGAVAAFRRALELDPKLAQAHTNHGTALQAHGDLAGAVAAFRRAVDLDPKLAMAHYNLGNTLKAQGDLGGPSLPTGKPSPSTPSTPMPTTTSASLCTTRGTWGGPSPPTAGPSTSTPRTPRPTPTSALPWRPRGTWGGPSPPSARPSTSTPSSPWPTPASASPCTTRGTWGGPSPPSTRPSRSTPSWPRPTALWDRPSWGRGGSRRPGRLAAAAWTCSRPTTPNASSAYSNSGSASDCSDSTRSYPPSLRARRNPPMPPSGSPSPSCVSSTRGSTPRRRASMPRPSLISRGWRRTCVAAIATTPPAPPPSLPPVRARTPTSSTTMAGPACAGRPSAGCRPT
jgi:serine/threonine protein kinase